MESHWHLYTPKKAEDYSYIISIMTDITSKALLVHTLNVHVALVLVLHLLPFTTYK